MKITIIDTAAYLDTPYNPEFVSQIKNIGGARWDSSRREWKIPAACVEQAREIMRRVFGECDLPDETRRVNVKLTFSESVCGNTRESLIIFGKQIARAYGRDSGAVVGGDVSFIEGKPTSDGSRANYYARVPAGAVALLRNVPESILHEDLPDGVTTRSCRKKLLPTGNHFSQRKRGSRRGLPRLTNCLLDVSAPVPRRGFLCYTFINEFSIFRARD